MEDVLIEHNIRAGTLSDDQRTAAKVARLISADGIIAGTIFEDKSSLHIIAHLIDSETSIIVSSNDVFGEEKSLMSVKTLLEMLAYKFKRDFPLIEGLIIKINGSGILVDSWRYTP